MKQHLWIARWLPTAAEPESGRAVECPLGVGGAKEKRSGVEERKAGWVARTRLLAEPLSPRGPQPVLERLRAGCGALNGPLEPLERVPESWY